MSRQPLAKSSSSFPSHLSPWLEPSRLRELVEARVYARGEELADAGGVTKWSVTPTGLEGDVRGPGRALHDVVLSVDEQGLDGDCSCERYLLRGFCEHLVALALVWNRAQAPEKPAESTSSRPRTPEQVRAWLAEHQVAHLERVPLMEVKPFLPHSTEWRHLLFRIAHHPLVSLLDGTLRPSFLNPPRSDVLERAAWARVEAEVESVRRGLERERLHPGPPAPTDARLAPLVQALHRLRGRVREHAVPRELPANSLTLVIHGEPPAFLVYELPPSHAHMTAGEEPVSRAVRVDLSRALEGGEAVVCSHCDPTAPARCVHAVSALDRVMEALSETRRAEQNARLAERLFVEPGRKLLEALDKARVLADVRSAPASGAQVSFRLEGVESGSPRLRPLLHRPAKKGGVSKGSLVSSRDMAEVRELLTSPEEEQALELCLLMERQYGAAERHPLLVQALKLLAPGHRLVLDSRRDTPLRVRALPLGFSLDEGEPGEDELWVEPSVEGLTVLEWARGKLRDRAPLPWLFVHGEAPEPPELVLVSVSPAAMAVLSPVVEHGGRLPLAWRAELLERLGGVESAFPLSLPPALEGREVPAEPGLLLRLRPTGAEALEGQWFARPLSGARPRVPGEGSDIVRGSREGERVWTRRNLEDERARVATAMQWLGLPMTEPSRFELVGAEASLGFLERLEEPGRPAWDVEWEDRPWRLVRTPEAKGLKVSVHRERDWFSVKGGVRVEDERVELAVLLDALRRGHRYVPLGKGRWLRITQELRGQLQPLADVAHASRGHWEVGAAAVPALDALAEAGADVQEPPDWRRLAGRIRKAGRLEVPVPAGLRAELRDYQHEGFEWMARLAEWGGGGCLADDMGLGKTLQTLALLLRRADEGPALVVAPTSVCFNWLREAERFTPSLKMHAYRDAERETLLSRVGAGDVVVVSYGLLTRELERFTPVSFATLVLDEAQAVKNPDTARARALRSLQAEARIALSGTPVENRLSELWSLFRLVFPGLLGSRESFRQRFAAPIERDKDPEARAALARLVRPFLLRRTKAQVARELPSRVETVVPITLSEAERRLYEDTRLAALARIAKAEGQEKRFAVLAALTRLRLAACHPRFVDADSPVPSSKLERLLELVDGVRAEGGRALVFSQFVKHLTLVREALDARGVSSQYLDGGTPAAEREARVAAFQGGEGDVFLISLKAGGTGLNLTAADHVFHLDPWWNPAAEDQATDRAHRIGQTRPVTVMRLIAEGTIEEAILALHEEKRDLASSLLSEADGAAALSTEQLLGLLRASADGERAG
ncbi:DEAD/DEAH box helicase [Cystobacter fuscus]|uniref:DEAD/DEAH box helicase n=1 Tax=Cystobacter fuscus TaxID=43 RepID=UPI002B2F19C8|nr:DEAD/DEAH box helicase [Cystobacter fuscus]